MKINHIINETTTAGAVATVAKPLGEVEKRMPVKGLQPAEKVMSGKSKKKGPYQNSLNEGKMKELAYDLENMRPTEFQRKYGKRREEVLQALKPQQSQPAKPMQTPQKPMSEAELQEDDLIIVPGQGMKRKTGFVPHGQSRVDHEVDMARSDLVSSIKNAKSIYDMLKDRSEEEGIEGWVQEKLIKAADYLNAVKEYLDEKQYQQEGNHMGGVIAGGISAESKEPVRPTNPPQPVKKKPMTPFGPGKEMSQDKLDEKAVSKAQQRFMGMVHAVQKGEMKAPSKAVASAAKGMSKKAGHDYAATKHKGLPEKVKKKD